MGFPFITKAFDEDLTKEIKRRSEKKLTSLNRTTPFIWLSSCAVVGSGNKRPDNLDEINPKYNGCIISNHLDPKLKYTLKESVLGYDLDGNLIKVVGEKGLKISPPIIESMEIDTDGENNTLKIAKINITIFSLKQLEMFELFFLKPQMTVVMEYGNNVPEISLKNTIAAESFLKGKRWDDYVKECIKYFSPNSEEYRKTREDYYKKIKRTEFNYDFWIGRVTNFNITYEGSDNLYKVQLEISSGNELHLWMPIHQNAARQNAKEQGTTTPTPVAEAGVQSWMKELCSKLILSEETIKKFITEAKQYEDEFFNWGLKSDSTKTETASKESYISFKLILKIMNDLNLVKMNEDDATDLTTFKANDKPCIPVTSHPNIISTNSNFIIPGSLPSIVVNKKERSINLDIQNRINYQINKKSFNYDKIPEVTSTKSGETYKVEGHALGNLLNIFVRTDYFVSLYKSTYTYADFFNSILGDVNKLMFGVCKLGISQPESDLKCPMTIIDRKIIQPTITKSDKIYRFKLGATESIVHDISFNLELSNLMQAQALYESQYIILKSKDNKPVDPNNPKEQTAGNTNIGDRQILKYISQPNLDNLYSADWVNYKVLSERNNKKFNKTETTNGSQDDVSEDKEAEADKKLNAVISGKSVKFKSQVNGGAPVTLIYNDSTFIQAYISVEKKNSSVLTYLECEVTIDGISGLRCGELFHIDGVPETYNINGAFQILNLKQSLQDDTGWRTTISAGFRYNIE